MIQKVSYATLFIIVINIVVAVLLPEDKMMRYAAYSISSEEFSFMQLLTSMWIHNGYVHLAINLFVLWSFGDLLEKIIGSQRFFFLYMVCGIVGVLIVSLVGTPLPVVGASISIMGIMTGLAIVEKDAQILLLFMVPLKIRVVLVLFVAIEILSLIFFPESKFSHVGHLSGVFVTLLLWRVNKFVYYG